MSHVQTISRAPSPEEISFRRRGQAAFAERFPGQDFEAPVWSIRHLKKSGAGQGNVSLYFTRIVKGHREEPLPSRFADMLKAHFTVGGRESGTMVNGSTAARWLWEAIRNRLGSNDAAFSWQGFTKEDVERAERLMQESGMKSNSVYRRCVDIQAFLGALSKAGVIAPIVPDLETPRQDSLDRMTLEGRAARDELLPSEEAIRALADVYNGRYDLDPFEQLLACVPAAMFASGLRIIEPLQFSLNPVRTEGKRSFLFYFKAKGKAILEDKIPLTDKQASLARDAVDRAVRLTREARERAKELVKSPDVFPMPAWAAGKDWLTKAEVSELLGIETESVNHLPKSLGKRTDPNSNEVQISQESLRQYLQAQRQRLSLESIRGVTKRADGTWLPLDEALFICFHRGGDKVKGTSPLLVRLVTQQQIGTFLGGAGNGAKSIFERLGLREKDGRFINLNSHQIRHYVTSKASGAGISDAHLVRWQRRAHEGDLDAYKHLTSEERLRRLREHVRSGRLKGEIATMYFALAEDDRDVFLESVVQAIHVTHLGFCVHDFNTSPCPSAMNCVKRCGSFLFDTADQDQRKRLTDLKRRNERALDDALTAESRGQGILVKEWVNDLRATIEGLDIVLSAEADEASAVVAPFAGSPTKFQELK